jgi:hypothetical protein
MKHRTVVLATRMALHHVALEIRRVAYLPITVWHLEKRCRKARPPDPMLASPSARFSQVHVISTLLPQHLAQRITRGGQTLGPLRIIGISKFISFSYLFLNIIYCIVSIELENIFWMDRQEGIYISLNQPHSQRIGEKLC